MDVTYPLSYTVTLYSLLSTKSFYSFVLKKNKIYHLSSIPLSSMVFEATIFLDHISG